MERALHILSRSQPNKSSQPGFSRVTYNVLTFLPKSLFEQFRRVANLYFLSLTSLMSMIAPLVFVEDWNRFLQDSEVNSRMVKVHTKNGSFVEKQWKAVQGMEFRRCSIGGTSYGGDVYEAIRGAYQRVDADEAETSEISWESDMTMFLRVMAVCHTGIPVNDGGSEKLKYEAESPEEVTFLTAAQELGFQFFKRTQSSVPECIEKLAQAGLQIWLLTGDKKRRLLFLSLAVCLPVICTCFICDAELKVMKDEMLNQIEAAYQAAVDGQRKALVVDGRALEIALRGDMKDHFLRLAVDCASVICCRVSPKQKAMITRLVKKYTGKITLAIRDGANDVGMIQAADIGVGISGVEGMQAVMASDFSMPKFRFLERLLIVHGHWCYNRISKMILYFVYKNIVFAFTLFYHEVYSRFSGDVLYDGWYMLMFNLCLTSLPVISLGVLEQDVSSDLCLEFPALYQQGQNGILFSWKRIVGWMGNGILTSLSIFILNVYILSPSAFRHGGQVTEIAHLGLIMYTVVVWTVNCQISLIITYFTWIQHIFIWGSILCWYMFLLVYGALHAPDMEFELLVKALAPAPMYWIATLLVVAVSLLPYVLYMVIQRSFYPADHQLIQENKDATNVVVTQILELVEIPEPLQEADES